MIKLTTKDFKEKIFNFEKENEWKFEGNKPCIIDFYADWCQPCKIISPILEQTEKDFGGKIDVFKVNVDEETDLAKMFAIQSIPSMLFVPMNEQAQMSIGLMDKPKVEKAVNDILKITLD